MTPTKDEVRKVFENYKKWYASSVEWKGEFCIEKEYVDAYLSTLPSPESTEGEEGIMPKNMPKKIYLQVDADGETPEEFSELQGISWCSDRIHANDVEYVLSSPPSLVESQLSEIEKQINSYPLAEDINAKPTSQSLVESPKDSGGIKAELIEKKKHAMKFAEWTQSSNWVRMPFPDADTGLYYWHNVIDLSDEETITTHALYGRFLNDEGNPNLIIPEHYLEKQPYGLHPTSPPIPSSQPIVESQVGEFKVLQVDENTVEITNPDGYKFKAFVIRPSSTQAPDGELVEKHLRAFAKDVFKNWLNAGNISIDEFCETYIKQNLR